jgi:hypothetical protein
MSVEECLVCTEELGVPGRPASQLPCGHVFCQECVQSCLKNQHKDCPSCRAPFKASKLRALLPWQGGLRLKEATSAEQNALKGLEEVRTARAAMEQRAVAAERALRQRQAAAERAAAAERSALAVTQGTDSTPAADTSATISDLPAAIAAPAPAKLGLAAHDVGAVSGPANAAPLAAPTVVPTDAPPTERPATLTEAQRLRVEANRAAALERKRERDALAAAAAGGATV